MGGPSACTVVTAYERQAMNLPRRLHALLRGVASSGTSDLTSKPSPQIDESGGTTTATIVDPGVNDDGVIGANILHQSRERVRRRRTSRDCRARTSYRLPPKPVLDSRRSVAAKSDVRRLR